MTDSSGHGDVVLSAIVAGRGSVRALGYTTSRLTAGHFEDSLQGDLFTLLHRYYQAHRGIMTRQALGDVLRNKEAGSRLRMLEYYSARARAMPRPHEFLHSVSMLQELAADRATGEILAQGLEILRHGVQQDKDTMLRGHADAREHVFTALAAVERDLRMADSPEAEAHAGADDVLAAYARAKALRAEGKAPGVLFGIPELDEILDGGIGPGEMTVLLGGTTVGKSRLCIAWAWHASVMQGNLVARHSAYLAPLHGFTDRDGNAGLNARKIRAGRLTGEEEDFLALVIEDWKDEAGQYGRLQVVQMPEQCTVPVLAARHSAVQQQIGKVDITFADYLQLFEPERRSRDSREHESLSGVLKSFSRWAEAAGVAGVTPWQVNRDGRNTLRSTGRYQLENAAGSQEAVNTPDVVIGILDREEDASGGRRAPLDLAVMKVRDGPRGRTVPVEADYATCSFTSRREAAEGNLDLEMAGT
jgi:replicative DNA helicase